MSLGLMDEMEQREIKDQQENPVTGDPWDPKEHRVTRETRENKAQRGPRENRVVVVLFRETGSSAPGKTSMKQRIMV